MKLLYFILGVFYCNIGFYVRKYYKNNVFGNYSGRKPDLLARLAAGGWEVYKNQKKTGFWFLFLVYVAWPLFLFAVTLTWVAYFLYYTYWFIFCGGMFKLLSKI